MGNPRKRGRGEGSIYKRGDGRWTAAVTVGWRDGGRIRKQFYGHTRREVQDQLTKALRDQQLNVPLPNDRQTVGQFLDHWLEHTVRPTVRPRTHKSYAQLVGLHIKPTLGRIPLTHLAPEDLQRLFRDKQKPDQQKPARERNDQQKRDKQKSGLSPRTVQYIRAVLRRALGQALKWGLVARNVATLVDPPRVVRPDIQPFTPEQVPALLKAIGEHRLGTLYRTALSLGLRQGEALALRWQDVDLDAKQLRVDATLQRVDRTLERVEPKTARSRRTLALPESLVDALKAHRTRHWRSVCSREGSGRTAASCSRRAGGAHSTA